MVITPTPKSDSMTTHWDHTNLISIKFLILFPALCSGTNCGITSTMACSPQTISLTSPLHSFLTRNLPKVSRKLLWILEQPSNSTPHHKSSSFNIPKFSILWPKCSPTQKLIRLPKMRLLRESLTMFWPNQISKQLPNGLMDQLHLGLHFHMLTNQAFWLPFAEVMHSVDNTKTRWSNKFSVMTNLTRPLKPN